MTDRQSPDRFISRWSQRKLRAAHEQTKPAEESAGDSRTTLQVERQLPHQDSLSSSDLEPDNELTEVDWPSGSVTQEISTLEVTGREAPDRDDILREDAGVSDVLTDTDMPEVASLTVESDLSVFFSKGVSASLRRAALRQVFHQPRYNLRDGLDDYDDDYSVFEPLGDTITSDMRFHSAREERLRQEIAGMTDDQAALEQSLQHEQVPDGQLQDGQLQDGHVQDGHVQDGHVQDEHVQDGHVQDEEVPDGHVQEEQVQQVQEEQVLDGQLQTGRVQHGQLLEDQIAHAGEVEGHTAESDLHSAVAGPVDSADRNAAAGELTLALESGDKSLIQSQKPVVATTRPSIETGND